MDGVFFLVRLCVGVCLFVVVVVLFFFGGGVILYRYRHVPTLIISINDQIYFDLFRFHYIDPLFEVQFKLIKNFVKCSSVSILFPK